MTLTNRLSITFLGALALILIGFSIALHVMANVYLHKSIDDRLSATLTTLIALVEDEPGGLDWEHDDRRFYPGQEPGDEQVRWAVLDENGVEVDRSKNHGKTTVLSQAGARQVDSRGKPWRVAIRQVKASRPANSRGEASNKHDTFLFSAGLPLGSVERTLRNLGAALVLLSTTIWGITALVGRRICRRALAPLTRMATAARELGADEPGSRLPVARTGDELEDLAFAFNGLLDRWHEALERQSRFAGDASHQLRTPLTALIGQVDVALRRDRPPEEYRRTLARVRDQSGRLRRIVEALLFLARADAEAGLPALEVFDLSSWTAEQIARRIEEGSGELIRSEPPPDRPILTRAHPALLGEVLDNLLDNARDHGSPGTPAVVQVTSEPGWARLSVQDRGPGIAESDLSRIFEPFYRTKDARRAAPGGVGLGLAVARRIAQALGGRLEVESQPGHGSRFVLRLPEVVDVDPKDPTAQPVEPLDSSVLSVEPCRTSPSK